MNLSLDTKVIILILGIGYLFTLILIIAYKHGNTKNLTANTFILAKSTQTIAWFCMIFRGGDLEFLSISFANSLLFIGYTLEIIALLSLKQSLHKKAKSIYLVLTLLSIIGFHFILIFNNKENIRIAYCAFVNAVIYIPVYRMVFGKALTPLMRMIGSIYLLAAVACIVRGIVSTSTAYSTSFYTPGTYQMISLLSIYIFTNLGSIGFILLMKEKADDELIRFASYDDLTGTLNRRTFTENAKHYLMYHAKKRQSLTYILFDIDNFKRINDTFGHHIGDRVLQDLTMQIRQHLDKDDLFVRYGGDEFGILLPGKDVPESDKLAEQIKLSPNGAIVRGLPVTYTISIGIITLIPEHSTQLDMLYTYCDKALYKAKSNGRNGIFRSQIEELFELPR
ncbi:MAG TPA: GGDEF domain-containing protein [Ureibacillus sp.]|nr:GGDEF domain-containing protein [Ureibacillus sp.]